MTPPNGSATSEDDSSPPNNSAVGRVRVPSSRPAAESERDSRPAVPYPDDAEGSRGEDGSRPAGGDTAGRARVPMPESRGRASVPMPQAEGHPPRGRASVPVPQPQPAEGAGVSPPSAPPRGKASVGQASVGQPHLPPPPPTAPQPASRPSLGHHPSRGTAKVGAFEDTGTFKAISIPDYERASLTAEDRARRVSTTGQFPQVQVYDYERFSELSGEIQVAPAGPYEVQYRKLPRRRPIRTGLFCLLTFGLEAGFFGWLIAIGAVPHQEDGVATYLRVAGIVLVVSTVLVEGFRLVSIFTLVVGTINCRNPIPVWPSPELRVAFLTTIVPGKEPIEMVEHTLKAARKIRHPGKYDVWLLDEGDDPEVRAMCARIGVHHFSRRGVDAWNTPAGPHKAKTKHGNYNAWIIQHGAEYDVFVSVDPDHAPLPNYCERMLGYFRDPDVAFVIGPQVYGNCDNFITKSAESQQYMFHAIIQRAGNRYGAPMLVGTNNAIRISAIMAVQGVQDSITEDFATGMLLHGTKNDETGRRWKSVYTPDVLAVGEGPSSWSDFFTQQHRWSRGTHELLVQGNFPRLLFRLGPKRMFFYTMLLVYYPTTALMWLVGALNSALFLVLGANGVLIPFDLWLMLYIDAGVLQTALYFWNRRHNVSPHEAPGSTGLRGGFISLVCGPVYASSLSGTILRRRTGFVITPKGDAASADRLLTFRKNVQWAFYYTAILVCGVAFGHIESTMWGWSALRLLLCVAPILIWMVTSARRRKSQQIAPSSVQAREMEPAA